MKKAILASAFLLAFTITVFGQDGGPKPDRWRNAIIDETTPTEAITLFGKPHKELIGPISSYPIDALLTNKRKEKIYKIIQFKKLAGVDSAFFTFQDDKLVKIDLMLSKEKQFSPQGLASTYELSFEPVFDALSEAFGSAWGDMKRDQGKVYARTFPTVYNMVAKSEKTFINATVGNVPSFGRAFGDVMGIPNQAGTLPGKVYAVSIISLRLENKDGAEVLK